MKPHSGISPLSRVGGPVAFGDPGAGTMSIRRPRRGMRRGFSFIEILFAVTILAVGFIMVAGIFPVAIGQTQANGAETTAASIARAAASTLARLPGTADESVFVPDGMVHAFDAAGTGTTLFDRVKGDLIQTEDSRFAWVPLYRRNRDAGGNAERTAQVFIVAIQAHNPSNFDARAVGDLHLTGTRSPLIPRKVRIRFTDGGDNPDIAQFSPPAGGDPSTPLWTTDLVAADGGTASALPVNGNPGHDAFAGCIAPGTFIIVADDQSAAADGPGKSAIGWVLRVGNNTTDTSWELQAGNDMKNSSYKPTTKTVLGWALGQRLRNPTLGFQPDPTLANYNPYEGGAQDVAVYSTIIPLN